MRKAIAATTTVSVLAWATVLLLSACTSFQGSEGSTLATTSRDAPVFRGKIVAPRVDGESSYLLGCVFQERKKHRLAIEEFRSAVQSDPGNVSAHNRLGMSLDALGDYDGAADAYAAALKIDGNLDYVLNNLGYSYLLQGRPDLAVDNFEKAVALDGNKQRYHNNLGLAYAECGRYDAALAAFKEGGDDARAHSNMARFYYRNGLYEKAGTHFAWASILGPSDADTDKARTATDSLAQIHANSKRQLKKTGILPAQETEKQMAQYDDGGGFSTIPAGAIENRQIVAIDQAELAETSHDFSNENDHRPIQSLPLARRAGSGDDRSATGKTLEVEPLETQDEAGVPEILSLEATNTEMGFDNRVKIEVSNGNGVRGMARIVGNYLRINGIPAYRLTNADHFNHPRTVIYYREGFQDQASRVKCLLPGISGASHLVAAHLTREPIRVLIGRDLVVPFNDHLQYDFNVDVSNGNGVNGMARRLGKHLSRKGFRVGRLTNADHFEYKRTIVYYGKGQSDHARLVTDALPGDFESRMVEMNNSGNVVQVVLGSDMAI